jgi:SAM-dependent methyltransferase
LQELLLSFVFFCYPLPAMNRNVSPHVRLLRGPVALSHLLLGQFVHPGDMAVDATCGNGNDTLLLAHLVGDSGRVWAFDIQEEAIRSTSEALARTGLQARVELVLAGHESMADHLPADLGAVVFNLGYLPGGDSSVITRPETTLTAAQQALELLRPAGILVMTVYPGHPGGEAEQRAVDVWAAAVPPSAGYLWRMGQQNVSPGAPYALFFQKRAS